MTFFQFLGSLEIEKYELYLKGNFVYIVYCLRINAKFGYKALITRALVFFSR